MKKAWRPNNRALFSVYVWLSHKSNFFERNLKFIRELKIPQKSVIHISRRSATLIIHADSKTLSRILSDVRCVGISDFTSQRLDKMSEEILAQMDADSFTGSNSVGISGKGVRFGMISAEREIFSLASAQLKSAAESGRIDVIPYPIPPIPSLHPSVVLSEIIGSEIEINGEFFRGMTSEASVLFSTSETSLDLLRAIERMIEAGIRVINLSAGINVDGYTALDRQIDRLIEENDILLVVPSGNRRIVASPGSSFNTLSVGNLQTKSSPTRTLPPPWSTRCTSDVSCSGFLTEIGSPHKPDVCAPGTYIPYVTPTLGVYAENTGTSFACPWVTGIAIQLLEVAPKLSALELKAIIALSCRRDVISEEFNEVLDGEPFSRMRSGFGCVNSDLAIKIAANALTRILESTGNDKEVYSLSRGERLFCAICFNKNTERQGEELILRLVDSFGSFIVCDKKGQNLHVAEYTASSDTEVSISVEGSVGVVYAKVLYIEKYF